MSRINTETVIRLVCVSILGIGFLFTYLANNKRKDRCRQVLLPLFAMAWMGVGQIALRAWATPAHIIRSLLSFLHLGPISGMLADGPLFDLAFLASFAVIKRIWLSYMMKRGDSGFFSYREPAGVFYEQAGQKSRWLLKNDMVGLRTLSRATAIIILLVALVVEWLYALRGTLHVSFVPLIVAEIAYFLGGLSKDEEVSAEVEHEGSSNVYSYMGLHRALRHYFGDRELTFVSASNNNMIAEGNADICAEMVESADVDERLCGSYFSSVLREGLMGTNGEDVGAYEYLDHDRMIDTVRLMHGKSILFSSPYYGDYVPYVALPLSATLLRGGKVLFVVGLEATKDQIPQFVDECVSFVTNVPGMWEVEELAKDGSLSPDVAVVSHEHLDDLAFLDANARYFEQVSLCFIIDPSSLLTTFQIGFVSLADKLSKPECPTYCAFDRNVDGLVDSLSHSLRVQLLEVGATERSEGVTYGMFWEVDGPQLQNRLMDGVARYLGMGTELAIVALKEQVNEVTWTGSSASPLLDMRWIDGQYYAELFEFAELPQEQGELDRHVTFCPYPFTLRRCQRRFIVAEDEHNNMFEEYRLNASRGARESFVNILAPNYLLRLYMAKNAQTFFSDPKAVPAFAPDVSKSPRNVVYGLVMGMVQTGEKVCEEEIARRLRYVGYPFDEAGSALAYLLIEYFANLDSGGLGGPLVCDEREEYDSSKHAVVTRRYFGISVPAQESYGLRVLRNVPLITEMPDGTKEVVGTRVYDQLYQSYLEGQFLCMQGKYYEVVSASLEAGLLLRRAADHFSQRRYYRQLRTYSIRCAGVDGASRTRSLAGVKISTELAGIDVSTRGYLEMSDFGNICDARTVLLDSVPDRHYVNKEILRLAFEDAGSDVARTIAVVLSESLVTLFPKDYQYLAVLCMTSQCLPEGILYNNTGGFADNEIVIVEDCSVDIGLLSAVDRNAQRILELCFDYLDWHMEMLNESQLDAETEKDKTEDAGESTTTGVQE